MVLLPGLMLAVGAPLAERDARGVVDGWRLSVLARASISDGARRKFAGQTAHFLDPFWTYWGH